MLILSLEGSKFTTIPVWWWVIQVAALEKQLMDQKIRFTKLVALMDALKVKGLQVNKVWCVANFVSNILQRFETKVCKVIVRSRHIGVLGDSKSLKG